MNHLHDLSSLLLIPGLQFSPTPANLFAGLCYLLGQQKAFITLILYVTV